MLATIFLIVILPVGFHLILCNKDIPVIHNDSPVEMCIHFKSCSTGSMQQTCLKYDKKLTPAKATNESGIQDIYLEMFPTIVTSTFDTGGQVCTGGPIDLIQHRQYFSIYIYYYLNR